MKITLNLNLLRPDGLHNNAAAGALVDKLDSGLFTILLIALEDKESVNIIVSWEVEEEFPVIDQDQAEELAVNNLATALGKEWTLGDVECVDFEPDADFTSEVEHKAQQGLGDRPFGG